MTVPYAKGRRTAGTGGTLDGEEMGRIDFEPAGRIGCDVARDSGGLDLEGFAGCHAEQQAAGLGRMGMGGGPEQNGTDITCKTELHRRIPTVMVTEGQAPLTLKLAADAAGLRLDRALAIAVPTQSRERLKALISSGSVEIDGRTVRDPASRIKGGEAVRLVLPPPAEAAARPQAIALQIVYEDPHLLVVDKPAGLVVHPAAGNPEGTLVNALLHHCSGQLSGIGGVARPGIVHRIDKDTSGLLVVAKTDPAHRGLALQFAAHSVKRRYLAVVHGVPALAGGRIETNLARSPVNRHRMAPVQPPAGKHAVTHWQVLERLQNAAAIECRLETGRTHQVRAHMAHLGHPLLGDMLYGGRRVMGMGIGRQALHARSLGFQHPVSQENLEFESPVSPDIQALLMRLSL
jgi:23S rRNA pseudouridine1911/1915/1917 synthase